MQEMYFIFKMHKTQIRNDLL